MAAVSPYSLRHAAGLSGFFRIFFRIFRKILFFEFFEKWPPKNSKKNYLIIDAIWLQFG
jgi:hypothetical protein